MSSPQKPKDRKPRRRRAAKKSSWKSMLCMETGDGKPWGAQVCERLPKISSRGKSKSGPTEKFELYDGTHFEVDYGDDFSDDWDLMRGVQKHGDARTGPSRRNADELDIKLRDLFPCFGELFDFCGCAKKPTNRCHVKPRSVGNHMSKVETVCLDCGHILAQRQLDKSVTLGTNTVNVGRPKPFYTTSGGVNDNTADFNINPLFSYGYGDPTPNWEQKTTFNNYHGWKYPEDRVAQHYTYDSEEYHDDGGLAGEGIAAESVPLPNFGVDDPRQFRTRPRRAGGPSMRNGLFDRDESGRVALPTFPV